MPKTSNRLAEIFRAMRFAIVGLGATLVHLLVAQGAFATGAVSSPLANVIGFVAAFIAGFLGHHHFTFSRTAPLGRAFRRYGVIALAGFVVNNVVLFGLVSGGVVGERVALTIAILIVPAGTFLASRFWGFVASAS